VQVTLGKSGAIGAPHRLTNAGLTPVESGRRAKYLTADAGRKTIVEAAKMGRG